MFDKLEGVERRFIELESRLADPILADNPNEFRKLSREHASLMELVEEYRSYRRIKNDIEANKDILSNEKDSDLISLAKEELKTLEPDLAKIAARLQVLLLPQDPNDQKNILIEIRAGAGGDESALFCFELFRAYQRYCEKQGWKVEVMSSSQTGIGGLKEIVAMIEGQKVYSRLKFEAGVHRVQRVPDTEGSGRVHTSTITVAILPEAEEVDVVINSNDLRIDVFRSSGAGGQSVNTTDSAVRIVHIPTNTTVICMDERSQLKNKDKAMKILRSRILEAAREKAHSAEASARKAMVGTGDRSERIRTYNFPQSRVTDHRIGLTLHNITALMEGDLDEMMNALQANHQMEALKDAGYATK